jgi:hypothetical protein
MLYAHGSPESNGTAKASAKTFKRDHLYVSQMFDARTFKSG